MVQVFCHLFPGTLSIFYILPIIWFSLQVEYIDHSGQAKFAFAEAPNEALPYNCRPNFGAAWLTKDIFKVSIEASASGTTGRKII